MEKNIENKGGSFLVILNRLLELCIYTTFVSLCGVYLSRYMGGAKIYYYMILAGLTGALWGVGVQRLYDSFEKVEQKVDHIQIKASKKNSLSLFLRFILLFLILSFLGFIIDLFELY